MKKIGSLLFLFFAISILIPTVRADDSLRLVPAHPNSKIPQSFTDLMIEGKPGEEKKAEFAGVNLTDEKVELKLETYNAQVSETGLIIADKNISSQSIGSWISINTKDTELLPKERKNFPVTVKIPADAKPGQHIAVIAGNNSDLPVWISVDGEVKSSLTLVSFTQDTQNGQPVFKVKIKNNGNTVVNSLGFKIVLINLWGVGSGRNLESFWGEDQLLLPGKEKEFLFNWESALPFIGNYQAELAVYFGRETQSAHLAFSFYNIKMIGVFLFQVILALGAVIGSVFLFRKFKSKISLKFNRPNYNPIALPGMKPAGSASFSGLSNNEINNQIKQIAEEEKAGALAPEVNNERLFFQVRKIVREEIELWKEMENFRREVKEQLKKELTRKKSK